MTLITPGIDFIVPHLVKFSILPVLFTFAAKYLSATYNTLIPTWIVVATSASTVLFLSTSKVIWKSISDRRAAAALGARPIPVIKGKWIGNLDILKHLLEMFQIGYPAEGITELVQQYGPASNVRILWADMYFTCSPEHIKLILATGFDNHVKGTRFYNSVHSVLGTGVFNSDGDMWKFHRSMTRPFFTRDRISDFDLFDRHADTAIAQVKTRMRTGYAIDFHDLMSRFTLDSASEFLFGHCLHSLSAELPFPHNAHATHPATAQHSGSAAAGVMEFTQAFLEAQAVISRRERHGWTWPLLEMWGDASKKSMDVVNAYLAPIIQDAIQKKASGKGVKMGGGGPEKEAEGTLIDHLVELTSDPVVLRDETLNIMIAGRDTTAATMAFIVYFLAMYPAVMTRLREEILAKVGPSRRPDYDDIRDMKYLRAVINETLRLFPTVPMNTRENIEATTWSSPDPNKKPIYIPAGTKIVYSVFNMHRRQDLWGPDAEEFDPDRFLDDRLKQYLTHNPFIFLPFNAGPRICLGQQFAYNEMSFMIIRFLQHFSSITLDTEACPPEDRPPAAWKAGVGRKAIEQVWAKMHLTMYPAGGLWVKLQEADADA